MANEETEQVPNEQEIDDEVLRTLVGTSSGKIIIELVKLPDFEDVKLADEPLRTKFEIEKPEGHELTSALAHHEGCILIWEKV